jgi:hypothetical protein
MIAPRTVIMFMKRRCRPPPRDRPSRKTARPVMSQNRKSVAAVTAFDGARRRTTRNRSYMKPAAAPRIREEAA